MADRSQRFSTHNTLELSQSLISQSRGRRSATASRKEFIRTEDDNWAFFNNEIKRCRDILSRLRVRSPVATTAETKTFHFEPQYQSLNRSPILETSDRGRFFDPPMKHPDDYYESSMKKKYLAENDWTSPTSSRTRAFSTTSGKKTLHRYSSARRYNDFLYDDYTREDEGANKSLDQNNEDIPSERPLTYNQNYNKIENITRGRPYRTAILREKRPEEEMSPLYYSIKSNAEKNRDFFASELERLKEERRKILQETYPIQHSFENTLCKSEYPMDKLNHFRSSVGRVNVYKPKFSPSSKGSKLNKSGKKQSSKSKRMTSQYLKDSKYKTKKTNPSHEGLKDRIFRDTPSKPIYPVQKTNLLYMGLPTTYAREEKYLFRF